MDSYLGQIQMFGFNFAPVGWMECLGQTLSIQEYTALYSLIGTHFGGDGRSNFMLPNLQNAAPNTNSRYYICTNGIYPSRS